MLLDPSFSSIRFPGVGGARVGIVAALGRRRDAEHNADELEATCGGKKNSDRHTNALACRDGAELEAPEEGKNEETERPVTEEQSIDRAGAEAAFGRWYLEWNQVARLPSSSTRCRDSFVLVVPAPRTVHRPGFVVITSTRDHAARSGPLACGGKTLLSSLLFLRSTNKDHLPSSIRDDHW